mgnify:CR=1 FL=1
MTRKDFKLISEVIKEIERPEDRKRTAMNFADRLQRSNPQFNIKKFLEACCVKQM